MDRGFWSYRLFCRIVQRDAFFAIREFSQARLKRVQTSGPRILSLATHRRTRSRTSWACPKKCCSGALSIKCEAFVLAPWSPTLRIPN